MTNADQERQRNRAKWDARKKRWADWKAMQGDFSLPCCLQCHKRFKPENPGQTACSVFCLRRFVVKNSR